MRYFSLFSGIGGFELGIMEAFGYAGKGEEVECVGYSEIDKYADGIYKKHFPEHKNYGDITKINERQLPSFDLLVGGFPCQSFSIAGKRRGFSDTRGTLFFDIARIVREKKPRLLLLENVKGLLSHEGGKTFAIIVSTLDELGYDIQWQLLNSKNHRVPQNRERVLIVGHLRGTPRPKVFPFGTGSEEHNGKANEQGCASTLTGRSAGGQNRRGNYVVGTLRTYKDGQGLREVKSGLSPTIPARAREDGSGQPVIAEFLERKEDSLGREMPVHRAFSIGEGMKVRRLTPVECERLQGFPDNWTEGISDTQRYKTLGNAVTVNVIRDVVERMIT